MVGSFRCCEKRICRQNSLTKEGRRASRVIVTSLVATRLKNFLAFLSSLSDPFLAEINKDKR
jgi:hypothetical protein